MRADRTELGLYALAINDPPLDEHALTDEVGDKAVGRAMVKIVGRIPLLNSAFVHDADFVGHGESFMLVVSDQYSRHALAFENAADLHGKPFAQVNVEVGEGLVKQNELRTRRQCARQCHPLLLSAGQFVRVFVAFLAESDCLKQFADADFTFLRRRRGQPERDIGRDGQVGEQGVILKNHADAAFFWRQTLAAAGYRVPFNSDFPGDDRFETGNAAQQGSFAATGRAEQAGDASAIDAETDIVDDLMRAVALNNMLEFEMSHESIREESEE